jgi:isoaspartyl peptidase/L-asparaginase-like protein (Ntn-hydrolase superfamily)
VQPVVVVHGGAGNPSRERLGDEARYHAGLSAAMDAAVAQLDEGAVAAAIAAVEVLEDDPAFNAGRGSVLTAEGTVEMDAAVMDGRSGLAGAVAAVSDVRHPVALARAVMERSPHVLLVAHGARRFADDIGMDATDPAWFAVADRPEETTPGTVGAVVLDEQGGLAAATSTGGRSQQAPGRVGDTPVIGAGTWADRRRAVSMTGNGEAILRNASAHSIALHPAALDDACRAGLQALGTSDGGLIAVDADGEIALPFNTRVMHRGWWRDGSTETRVRAS